MVSDSECFFLLLFYASYLLFINYLSSEMSTQARVKTAYETNFFFPKTTLYSLKCISERLANKNKQDCIFSFFTVIKYKLFEKNQMKCIRIKFFIK